MRSRFKPYKNVLLLRAHRVWGLGPKVNPGNGVRSSSSSVTPGGGVKRKRWRREVKKRKSSILARPSPGHTLWPEIQTCSRNEKTAEDTFIISEILFLLNNHDEQTCREYHEGISVDKLSLFIQEVGRVEWEWILPFVLIMQDRREQRNDRCPLWWTEYQSMWQCACHALPLTYTCAMLFHHTISFQIRKLTSQHNKPLAPL